jgi:hypothetical protein
LSATSFNVILPSPFIAAQPSGNPLSLGNEEVAIGDPAAEVFDRLVRQPFLQDRRIAGVVETA